MKTIEKGFLIFDIVERLPDEAKYTDISET